MNYKAKTLFTGYKLGLKNDKVYVAVPSKYIKQDKVTVTYENDKMYLNKNARPKHRETFNDKFRVGEKYTLYYYLWKPYKEELEWTRRGREKMFEAMKGIFKHS